MIELSFNEKYEKPVVLCLGRFESLHLGHRAIIEKALNVASKRCAEVCLMTFDNTDNLRKSGVILNYSERKVKAEELGVSCILHLDFNEKFRSIQAEDFLSVLNNSFNLKGLFCGFDFRFGENRKGNTSLLRAFCSKNAIPFSVTDEIDMFGEKVSSSSVKKYIEEGEMEKSNAMLGYEYSFCGVVEKGRKVGRELGFPTANVSIPQGKTMPKDGVYITRTYVGESDYISVTNVGSAPTFGVSKRITETYLDCFEGNLYGKEIKVEFLSFLRDIQAFCGKNELINELERNKVQARNYFKNKVKV